VSPAHALWSRFRCNKADRRLQSSKSSPPHSRVRNISLPQSEIKQHKTNQKPATTTTKAYNISTHSNAPQFLFLLSHPGKKDGRKNNSRTHINSKTLAMGFFNRAKGVI